MALRSTSPEPEVPKAQLGAGRAGVYDGACRFRWPWELQECPPACQSTFVAIGQQDAGHEALLAVGAEGIPDEDLICCCRSSSNSGSSSQTQAVKLGGVEGVGLYSALSTRPPRPPLPQNPQPHPLTLNQCSLAANRTGKGFLGKLTASAPLALATAPPPPGQLLDSGTETHRGQTDS